MKEAKLFSNGQSQAVRLPKEFRFTGKSVFIRRLGGITLLIPKKKPWKSLAEACDKFTSDFMPTRDQGRHEREDLFCVKYLLDTNICIYIIKKKPTHVFERFAQHHVGDIGISAITYSELAFGVAHSQKIEQNELALQEFTAPLEILDYPAAAALTYGRIRANLTKRGVPIGPLDMLIASQALHLGVVLVTNNVTEFSRIPHLSVENWV